MAVGVVLKIAQNCFTEYLGVYELWRFSICTLVRAAET